MRRTKTVGLASLLLAVGATVVSSAWPPVGDQVAPRQTKLATETFAQLRQQIRPQPDESRWLEVPWLLDLHEARQKAAAEGKPLFVYSGGGATGIGPC
jgi:hypothetical protein